MNGAVASSALARLSSLQQLILANTDCLCWNPDSCLSAAAQLQQLTLLDLVACHGFEVTERDVRTAEQPELNVALPGLTHLRVLRLPAGGGWWPPLDLTHTSQLQELDNNGSAEEHKTFKAVQLPATLHRLDFKELRESHQLSAVAQLQQLQGLTFISMYGWPEETAEQQRGMLQLLQRVAQLPALQHISMHCELPCCAAAAAAGWAQLPQLHDLQVGLLGRRATAEEWGVIWAGLAAATSLSKLDLGIPKVKRSAAADDRELRGPGEVVAACGALAGLSRLSDLCLGAVHLVPGDALALTALTGLSRLVLAGLGDGVGDKAAAALARSCRQLRHLDLSHCSLRSGTCLAEIGQLKQLTELRLEGNNGITQQGLTVLTGLVQLQHLVVALEG